MTHPNSVKLALYAAAVVAAMAIAAPAASAKGCNGYVNQLEWGCAAWDNNNGPQYPHYKKPAAPPAKVAAPAKVAPPALLKPQPQVMLPNQGNGVIAAGGGNLANKNGVIAAGGGNLANKSGVIAAGGGNLKGH